MSVTNFSGVATNKYIILVTTANIGESTGQGRALRGALKFVEIGGVVLDWGMEDKDVLDANTTYDAEDLTLGAQILVDRIDSNGTPTSVNASWNLSQTPVILPTAGLPGSVSEDNDFPIRVMWRKWWKPKKWARTVLNDTEGVLYSPEGTYVKGNNGTLNKRLRIKISDFQNLIFSFHCLTGPAYNRAESRDFDCWLQGCLYYRFIW